MAGDEDVTDPLQGELRLELARDCLQEKLAQPRNLYLP